jgi:hypothetical protein
MQNDANTFPNCFGVALASKLIILNKTTIMNLFPSNVYTTANKKSLITTDTFVRKTVISI